RRVEDKVNQHLEIHIVLTRIFNVRGGQQEASVRRTQLICSPAVRFPVISVVSSVTSVLVSQGYNRVGQLEASLRRTQFKLSPALRSPVISVVSCLLVSHGFTRVWRLEACEKNPAYMIPSSLVS
ncbi:unnamed protein product, partial [Meganyctiphanes norvegica]